MNKEVTNKMCNYFKSKPVQKAWVFGSFARGEERPDSDIDILVSFVEDANVSLFTIGGMYMDLKSLLGREIDLVEEGTLMPFAHESAEQDKKLVYERAY